MELMFMSVVGTTTTTVIATASTKSHWVCCEIWPCCATDLPTSARSTESSSPISLSAWSNSATALPLMRLAMVAVS